MGKGTVQVHVVDQDEHTSVVQVRGVGAGVELFVRSTGRLAADQSMWLPLVLPVAMRHGKDLQVHGVVDEQVLAGATQAQVLLASWWPKLQQVDVTSDETTTGAPGQGVGLAFSAGVDAFHSLLRHQDEVTHLWFVHGFDVPLWRTSLRARISEHLTEIATATGKGLVEVITNVKPWADRHVRWGEIYHGPATAGVAIGHGPLWGRALIASTYSIGDLHPWGSHPELDPRWSSSAVTVAHDAVEVDRVEKTRAVAGWDVAMQHLRVCWENPGQVYNCGRCEKCQRTILGLHAVGADGACQTLPPAASLPVNGLARISGEGAVADAALNLAGLRSMADRDLQVETLLERALREGPALARRARARHVVRRLVRRG